MKPSFFSTMLGSAIGVALCYAYYQITGLQNPRFFADASLLRKAADLVCIAAFVCLGMQLTALLFRLARSSQA